MPETKGKIRAVGRPWWSPPLDDPRIKGEERREPPPGLAKPPEKPEEATEPTPVEPFERAPAPTFIEKETRESVEDRQARDLAISDFLGVAPSPITNQPTRAGMLGAPPSEVGRDWLAQPPKNEWERLGHMGNDEIEKEIGRIPHAHDFLLHFAPDNLDKFNLLTQLYGDKNVAFDQDKDLFIVREVNTKTGDVTYMRSDEDSWTWRDVEDITGGLVATAPELAAYVAVWSWHASKFPQHPYTKAGLLAMSATSATAGEAVGAVKDYAFRKYAIKTNPRTQEIAGRRFINFAIGVPAGYGIGRLFGMGKFTKQELATMEDISAMRSIEDLDFMLNDEIIAMRGQSAAADLDIMQTAAESVLTPNAAKIQTHAVRVGEYVPGSTSPMREFQLSRQRGTQAAHEALTGKLDYDAMARQLTTELSGGEHLLRHWSMGRTAEAVEAAVHAVVSVGGITKIPGKFDPNVIGDKLRFLMNKRKDILADEVGALYKSIEDDLATAGVGQFVQFKNLGKAIKEWRATRVPKVTKTTETPVPASTIVSPTGTPVVPASTVSETTRVPVGKFGEADVWAREQLALSSETMSLSEAQTMISYLGETVQRSGTGVEGSTGFTGAALNKFYGAAKDDLNDAFNALARQGKVGPDMAKRWADANKAHASKLDVLNKSKLIKNILRSGQKGGTEVNAREILTSLVRGGGKTGDLKLIKQVLGPGDFEEIRIGLLHDLVGLNSTIKIFNTTGAPLKLSGRHVPDLPVGDSFEVVDLSHLRKQVAGLDESFLRELMNDPGGGRVRSLKSALETYDKSMRLHGSLGKTSGVTADEWKAIVREFDVGSGGKAHKLMKEAIAAEKTRRAKYLDVLGKGWAKGDFSAITVNPQQFVDDAILGGGIRGLKFAKEIFPMLTPGLRDTLRNHVGDRIIARSIDVMRTPIAQTASGKGGGFMKPAEVVKAIYGDATRQRLIQTMFTPADRLVFRNLAEYNQVLARLEQLGGNAGHFSVQNAIGTGSAKNMIGQWSLAKIVFSDAGQDLLSRGAANKGNLGKLLQIMFDQRGPAAEKLASSARAAMRGDMPKGGRRAMAAAYPLGGIAAEPLTTLTEPSAKELRSLSEAFWWAHMGNRGGGFEAIFGGHRREAPSEDEITKFLEAAEEDE